MSIGPQLNVANTFIIFELIFRTKFVFQSCQTELAATKVVRTNINTIQRISIRMFQLRFPIPDPRFVFHVTSSTAEARVVTGCKLIGAKNLEAGRRREPQSLNWGIGEPTSGPCKKRVKVSVLQL